MFNVKKKAASPLYEQIKAGLRTQVEAGRFKPGDCIPDENDLAAQLNVSHMTVRRAVVELSREGLFKRIVGKGTFVRDAIAAQTRTRKGSVAVLSTAEPREATALGYYRQLQFLMMGLEEIGMPVVFRSFRAPYTESIAAIRADRSLRAIVTIWAGEQKLAELLANLPLPVVLLDSIQPEPPIFDAVSQDGELAVYTAVSHLLKLGHRDVGLMHSKVLNRIGLQRKAGYTRALMEHDVTVRPERFYPVIFWGEDAYTATRKVLNEPQPPTALVCTGDEMAVGAMAAVTEHGWRVPRDMSIVGFGDDGYFTVPQLSTVRVPLEQMGLAAARLLVERLKRPAAPPQRLVFPTEWIPRGSCDLPRASHDKR
jgi:GntR family transcriptional regulator of arabinose operon